MVHASDMSEHEAAAPPCLIPSDNNTIFRHYLSLPMHSSKHQHRHCGLLQSGHMCTSTTMPNNPASSLVNHELEHALVNHFGRTTGLLDERKLTNEYKTGICGLTCHERTTYHSLQSFQITGQIKENCMQNNLQYHIKTHKTLQIRVLPKRSTT